MSRLFISHNSADNRITEEIRQRLEKAGHHCVYVDFDPEQGIAAGQDWERDLYRELRACRALIILCSEASMKSLWCFAEVTHAKSMGKPVIPVKVEECQVHSILSRHQVIDWTQDPEQAWHRLQRGLRQAGIDPRDSFNWDGTRPPYPGLMSFQEEDAAIFFGRQKEIQEGLEILNRQHLVGSPRSLMVFGPSGSGKSSLVRAGLVPRLKANEGQWLVLDAIRPRGQPMKELVWTMRRAFKRFGTAKTLEELTQELQEGGPGTLCELAESLLIAADRRDASVLLVVDQAEELISQAGPEPTSEQRFLELVLGAIDSDLCGLQVIWTLRSDFMAAFQRHPVLRKLKSADLSLGLMDAADIAQVIEQPAALAGVDLEPGLTQKIMADVQGDDALPLLAFSLRELYEKYHQDGLEIREYDELGGLTGSIARSAEQVYIDAGLDSQQQADLRRVFLSLVRIGEDGSYARRVIERQSVPASLHDTLEAFVRARLLVAGGDDQLETLEVAHEAIFRAWRRLSIWLQEDQEFLRWMSRLESAARDWGGDEDKEGLLRGKALVDAEYHLKNHPAWSPGEKSMHFIRASRRRAGQQRRGRIGLVAMVMLALLGAALWNNHQASQLEIANVKAGEALLRSEEEAGRARRNLYNARLVLADAALEEDSSRARLELEDIARFPVEDRELTWGVLHGLARNGPPEGIDLDSLDIEIPGPQPVAVSPDGKQVAGLVDDYLVIWRVADLEQLQSLELSDEIDPRQIAWTPGVITILDDGDVLFFGTDPLAPEGGLEIPGTEMGLVLFTRDGSRMFASLDSPDTDCGLLIYDLLRRETETILQCDLPQSEDAIALIRLSMDERWLVMGYTDLDQTGIIQVYDLQQNKRVLQLPDGFALAMAFSNDPEDLKLAWGVRDGRIKITRIPSGESLPDLVGHTALVGSLDWSPDDSTLAAIDMDYEVRLWNAEDSSTLASLPVKDREGFNLVSFSPDGRTLVVLGEQSVRFWDARTGALRSESTLELDEVPWLNFLPGENRLLIGGSEVLYALDVDPARDYQALVGHRDPVDELFFPALDNSLVSKANDDTIRVWDLESGTIEKTLVGGAQKSLFHDGFLWGPGERYSAMASFDPAGQRIAWTTADGSIHVANIETGETLPWTVSPESRDDRDERPEVDSLAFSSAGKFLYILWEDGAVEQLDLDSGTQTRHEAPAAAESIEGIFPGPHAGYLLIWGTHQPDRRWFFETSGSSHPAFELSVATANTLRAVSQDGGLLAETASTSGTLKIRRLPAGDTIRALPTGPNLDSVFGFSSNGSLLLTQSGPAETKKRTLQVWKWSEGRPCAQLEIDQPASAAAISRDNSLLAYSKSERIMLRPIDGCARDP